MAKRNIHPEVTNWKIFTVAGGFYYFGEEIEAPEGYIAFTKASMFGGFSGGKVYQEFKEWTYLQE